MMFEKKNVGAHQVEYKDFGLLVDGNLVPLSTEPTEREIELILLGWDAGYAHGKQIGRAILQNDFRNLMNCQPR